MYRSLVVSMALGGILLAAAAASGDVFIDFETLPDGSPAESATPVADSYAEWGVSFSEIGVGSDEPQFWEGYYADGRFAWTHTCGGYPPGFNINAEFDVSVYEISVDVMTAAGYTVTMLAKDEYGVVIGTAVSDPAPSTYWAGRLSITTTIAIATVEWWPSAQNASVGIDDLAYAPGGGGELLYDVDFGTPPHTVGQPPVTGTGSPPRETPTSIVFGDPTVVAAVGALTDQPCAFGNGSTGYDQLRFGVSTTDAHGFDTDYDTYHIEMDVLVMWLNDSSMSNTFTVVLDTPSVRNLYFRPDENIRVWPPGEIIGTYEFGVPVFLEIDVDIPGNTRTISLDGVEAWSGSYDATELRSIRMNLSGDDDADSAAVDNFRVYGGGAPPGCDADLDGDGDTDLADLATLLAAYGTSVGDPDYNPDADFDGNGTVDLSDLAFLLADYGCVP